MEKCASPGLFFEVSPTQGIEEAMIALFKKTVGKARLVNSGYSKVMKDCASKPEYYFEISPGETVAAFASIGTSLTKLRLAE